MPGPTVEVLIIDKSLTVLLSGHMTYDTVVSGYPGLQGPCDSLHAE